MGRGRKLAKSKEAKPPVARKSPKNDGAKVRDLEKRLAEAQEQQAATAEILRVIASSPTDVLPIFEAIAIAATRLCAAQDSGVVRFDGALVHLMANDGFTSEERGALRAAFPRPADRTTVTGRAILTRAVAHIPDITQDPEYDASSIQRGKFVRAVLSVPMLRDGQPVGAITVTRREPALFGDAQIALLETFADQAVIAIENVRLFNATKEALEQQTATSEILRVISSSPTDVQPVFDAIAASAARVCGADDAVIIRAKDGALYSVAHWGPVPLSPGAHGRPVTRRIVVGRAILDRRTIHVPDIDEARDEYPDSIRDVRTILVAPLVQESIALGAIVMRRREMKPFSDKQVKLLETFADQAVIAIENVRLFNETKEALERQTATSEILRVISSSPTDVQPVFNTIVEHAMRLCEAVQSNVQLFDGERMHWVAEQNIKPEVMDSIRRLYPIRPDRSQAASRAVLARSVVHLPDVLDDPEYHREMALKGGWRSVLSVPMLREGNPIGAITVARLERFSETQIALLQTFADQAVIAIENVRLFNETREALEQQTATGEILKVISSSPTDVQPVFEAVARSAARFCDAHDVVIVRLDGGMLHYVAGAGPFGSNRSTLEIPVTRESVVGRAVVDRATVHVRDLAAESEDEYAVGKALQRRLGHHTMLATPLLREGVPIGAIALVRTQVQLFTEKQVALLQTFADQAVIAIENVRLFTELQEKNRALTEAHATVTESLERQTATSEILRVISSSPTETQPVFDAIARNAVALCGGIAALVLRYDGEMLHIAGHHEMSPDAVEQLERAFPRRPGRDYPPGRALLERHVVHIPDLQAATEFTASTARQRGLGSMLVVPLLREGEAIGVISLGRAVVGPFSAQQIEVLQTFADQAVIAIENTRLFNETKEALERQTATSEILRAISSSPTDVEPVFDTIVRSAVQLCHAKSSWIWLLDGDRLKIVAPYNVPTDFPTYLEVADAPNAARVIREAATLHIGDTEDDSRMTPEALKLARRLGSRALLTVPMRRHREVIGALTVQRGTPGTYSDAQVALLTTFADQAVIAIENVRLFTELQTSNRDLTTALDKQTATSDILRVISQSQTDVQPVFDAILASAVRLLCGHSGTVTRVEGDQIVLAAMTSTDDAGDAILKTAFPQSLRAEGPHPRAIRDRAPLNVSDAYTDPRLSEIAHANARVRGYQSQIVIPMIRQDWGIGTISVTRQAAGGFAVEEIALLQTFAAQAVIAIENARLLSELQARTKELTGSVAQLTALREVGHAVSSSLDLETVLNTIVARAVQLAGAHSGTIWEYDAGAEEFVLRITQNVEDPELRANSDARVRRGEGAVGRLAISQRPVQIPDITHEGAYEGRLRSSLVGAGTRALLAIPLLHEDQLLGGLVISRRTPGEFPAEVVELLASFATQSALALQNARLFLEIEDKSRQLEAASHHKSEFLANMSHELRTPLNAIIGFSEVLSEKMFGELNEKQEEYSKDIHASGQHLLSLINDILDLSKIEAGRMELELTDFHLPTALDSALTLVRERAGRRSIALHTNIDNRLGQIQADERKVRQVVLNLLSNAIKFTPEGGRIEVGAVSRDGYVEVSVSDTGVGIAPEDQEAVFEEFRQVGTADKKVEGTGLGLTLCRKFVELHGGRIWVKSELGVGSTFTFSLPLNRA